MFFILFPICISSFAQIVRYSFVSSHLQFIKMSPSRRNVNLVIVVVTHLWVNAPILVVVRFNTNSLLGSVTFLRGPRKVCFLLELAFYSPLSTMWISCFDQIVRYSFVSSHFQFVKMSLSRKNKKPCCYGSELMRVNDNVPYVCHTVYSPFIIPWTFASCSNCSVLRGNNGFGILNS